MMTEEVSTTKRFQDGVYAAKQAGRIARARLPLWQKLDILDQLRAASQSFDEIRATHKLNIESKVYSHALDT
jgi:hypothetical protein